MWYSYTTNFSENQAYSQYYPTVITLCILKLSYYVPLKWANHLYCLRCIGSTKVPLIFWTLIYIFALEREVYINSNKKRIITGRWHMNNNYCLHKQIYESLTRIYQLLSIPTSKVFKTRLKKILTTNAFARIDEFLAHNWEATKHW